MTDDEIILIRRTTHVADFTKPWADSIAFARAILAANNAELGRFYQSLNPYNSLRNIPLDQELDQ